MLSANSSMEETTAWVLVASVDQIGLGQGRCFLVGTRKIALFRLRNCQVYALDSVCPHRGGPLAEAEMAHQAGAHDIQTYGDFQMTPYNCGQSSDLLAVIEK